MQERLLLDLQLSTLLLSLQQELLLLLPCALLEAKKVGALLALEKHCLLLQELQFFLSDLLSLLDLIIDNEGGVLVEDGIVRRCQRLEQRKNMDWVGAVRSHARELVGKLHDLLDDDWIAVPEEEEKVFLFLALEERDARVHQVRNNNVNEEARMHGEEIVPDLQPFLLRENFRQERLHHRPSVLLRRDSVLDKMVEQLRIVVAKQVLHNAQDVDGWIWVELEPQLAPIA